MSRPPAHPPTPPAHANARQLGQSYVHVGSTLPGSSGVDISPAAAEKRPAGARSRRRDYNAARSIQPPPKRGGRVDPTARTRRPSRSDR
eukprot:1195016-Prorocentrum_minimum.AAC.4